MKRFAASWPLLHTILSFPPNGLSKDVSYIQTFCTKCLLLLRHILRPVCIVSLRNNNARIFPWMLWIVPHSNFPVGFQCQLCLCRLRRPCWRYVLYYDSLLLSSSLAVKISYPLSCPSSGIFLSLPFSIMVSVWTFFKAGLHSLSLTDLEMVCLAWFGGSYCPFYSVFICSY